MNPYRYPGMNTWMDQENDRAQWHKTVGYRKLLISELHKRGVQLRRPHNRKLRELEEILQVVKRYETSSQAEPPPKRGA